MMWLVAILLTTTCIAVFLRYGIGGLFRRPCRQPVLLPPGPPSIPILSSLLWIRTPLTELESVLCSLHSKYGPIVTLTIGPLTNIFISDGKLVHKALIQNGAMFANRRPSTPSIDFISCNEHTIGSASYGPRWRFFRKNLISEVLNPSRVKSFSYVREKMMRGLIARLEAESTVYNNKSDGIRVLDSFQHAMFCLMAIMCFGDELNDDEQAKKIAEIQRKFTTRMQRFEMLNVYPRLGRFLFRNIWNELYQLRACQEAEMISLIRARKRVREERRMRKLFSSQDDDSDEYKFCYVDSLLELEEPVEKRELTDVEIMSFCAELLDAGTDTTSGTLQWIMAYLVKHQNIQEALVEEMKREVGDCLDQGIRETDLQKLPYLKAVILEGLRLQPPAHFVVPHAVSEDTVLDGHIVPKYGAINFLVAQIGRDPKVWEDPMEFRPERFLSAENGRALGFDLMGSKEIKMMPFGAGRRMCPGYGLAMLHLEYFVANMVARFRWTAADEELNFEEKQELTTVMKYPLKARLELRD